MFVDEQDTKETMNEFTDAEMMAHYEDTIKIFDDGDIVEGKVVKVDKDEILVDIGYKSEGVIPIRELSIRSDVKPEEIVTVGEDIEALVLQKEDKDGRLILSKKRAEYERSWHRIEAVFKEEGKVTGNVIEVVKGGLILDIGLRGFLPASLVDLRRVKDLDQFVGSELECKVIEMDRNRNNVVLSRRAVLEQERRHERHDILSRLEKGQVLPGTISSIVDFGAFVDLGGIDGLIHISELSWTHVGHPSEVVSVGEQVQVQVLDVDQERERISLGLKQTREDPWKELVQQFPVGSIVEGKVTKLVTFGAFIELVPGVEGLCHISELAEEHVEVSEQIVHVGEVVTAKVMDVDFDRRRISLSLRQASATAASSEEEETTENAEAEEEETTEPTTGDEAEVTAEDGGSDAERTAEDTEAEVEEIAEGSAEPEAEAEEREGHLHEEKRVEKEEREQAAAEAETTFQTGTQETATPPAEVPEDAPVAPEAVEEAAVVEKADEPLTEPATDTPSESDELVLDEEKAETKQEIVEEPQNRTEEVAETTAGSEEETAEEPETESEAEPGSLEDVLAQMKKSRAKGE
ncbi:MAG: 30S ribosomal protein S1 [Actinobacteria bacterium]|nr:MAG: 30S ribosomal protein S1 [Actinomycetota bacterium]